MKNSFYNKKLKNFANSNRHSMTKSEACLWKYVLSKGQMLGYQFRRQRPIGNYIADFVCLPLKLIIEVDGISHVHEDAVIEDKKRDEALKALGYTTLRFDALDVLNHINSVQISIDDWVVKNATCGPRKPRNSRRK